MPTMQIKSRPRRKRLSLVVVVFASLVLLLLLYGFSLVNHSSATQIPENLQYLEKPPAIAIGSKSHPLKKRAIFQCIDEENKLWELNAAPSFIIAGVQKGGTSALRGILVQHPKMIASAKFEPHFFDSKLQRYLQQKYGVTSTVTTFPKEWLCDIRKRYIQSTFPQGVLHERHSDFYFFEKTPSYLVDPDVPALIDSICSWKPKILVVLRDPIERAYSHFQMEREKLRIKDDFETAIHKEIDYMRQVGLSSAPRFPNEPMVASDLQHFVNQLAPSQFELPTQILVDLVASDNAHKQVLSNFTNANFLQRGMYAPQLQRWIKYFPLGDSLLVLKFEDLQAHPASIYEQILDFLGAPRFDLRPEDFAKAYRTRGQYRRKGMVHPPLSNETRQYLELFFQPYNKMLTTLLERQYYGPGK